MKPLRTSGGATEHCLRMYITRWCIRLIQLQSWLRIMTNAYALVCQFQLCRRPCLFVSSQESDRCLYVCMCVCILHFCNAPKCHANGDGKHHLLNRRFLHAAAAAITDTLKALLYHLSDKHHKLGSQASNYC